MNYKILVIEDNPDVLLNIQMALEFNNYEVISANNGKVALESLNKMKKLPDLIISDIMMPEMDGYEFFKAITDTDDLGSIPFIFLSAKASPEDIRFGKMLGIDDYITKPFNEDDLLAIISGKINRRKKSEKMKNSIEKDILSKFEAETIPSLDQGQIDTITLLYMIWDEEFGPKLVDFFPHRQSENSFLMKTGLQLFHTSVSIYGSETYSSSQDLLLRMENLQKSAYIFFDSEDTPDVRGGKRLFMLTVLAPKISYFASLKMKETINEISIKIKLGKEWNIQKMWEIISEILTTPI